MAQTIKKVEFLKPYWVIAKSIKVAYDYDGCEKSQDEQTDICEFDTAEELRQFLEDCQVSAGESEGTEFFRILALSNSIQELEDNNSNSIQELEDNNQLIHKVYIVVSILSYSGRKIAIYFLYGKEVYKETFRDKNLYTLNYIFKYQQIDIRV